MFINNSLPLSHFWQSSINTQALKSFPTMTDKYQQNCKLNDWELKTLYFYISLHLMIFGLVIFLNIVNDPNKFILYFLDFSCRYSRDHLKKVLLREWKTPRGEHLSITRAHLMQVGNVYCSWKCELTTIHNRWWVHCHFKRRLETMPQPTVVKSSSLVKWLLRLYLLPDLTYLHCYSICYLQFTYKTLQLLYFVISFSLLKA